MATFLKEPDSGSVRATSGERRFADRLKHLLEDDYLCWFDVPVGPRHQHPDFVILHPRRGILILEAKDWRLDTIQRIDRESATLIVGGSLKKAPNPLAQARAYAHAVVNVLEADPLLRHPQGTDYEGRLSFPWGYGVVLTNITRKQFETAELGEAIHPDMVICRDEMFEDEDAEIFQQRLWAMFRVSFASALSLPQVERVRWHLFPDIRVAQTSLSLVVDGSKPIPDRLAVMDLEQEAIARSIGEGHRVIHGVAGSGKTLILAYRCEHLARSTVKPILVLVYNIALASWLQQQLSARGLDGRVQVRHFHGWCSDQLTLYHVPRPADGEQFFERLVQAVIAAVDKGQIPRAQYGAVLIDEGHDFEADWLRLAVQMLDPATNSLLLLYDDAQSLYGTRRSTSFTFKSVGIAASGRTRILRRNYRNTDEILTCAREFAQELLSPLAADEDGIPRVAPELGGRHGPQPRLALLSSMQQEAQTIADTLTRLHAKGIAWKDMAVLYSAPFVAEEIAKALDSAGVPTEWLRDRQSKHFSGARDSIKLMTYKSSKGLQFPVVVVAGVGTLPWRDSAGDARELYVAMTRATERLLITASRASEFVRRLQPLCAPLLASAN